MRVYLRADNMANDTLKRTRLYLKYPLIKSHRGNVLDCDVINTRSPSAGMVYLPSFLGLFTINVQYSLHGFCSHT